MNRHQHILDMAAQLECQQRHDRYKAALEQIAHLDDTAYSNAEARESMGEVARAALQEPTIPAPPRLKPVQCAECGRDFASLAYGIANCASHAELRGI